MPYTTAQALVQAFGLGEIALLLADEERLLTRELLRDAIAGEWTGDPSEEERAAAMEALARLQRRIVTQSNFMDGYLRAKMKLPIAPGDANAGTLEDCCNALVRNALADDPENATDRTDTSAAMWRAWLKDVASGKALLAGQDGQAVESVGGIQFGKAKSGYDWANFPGHWGRP